MLSSRNLSPSLLSPDLGRMYNLVSRITDGLGELKKLLETHIHNQGLAAIEKCGEAALNVGALGSTCPCLLWWITALDSCCELTVQCVRPSQDPKVYVQTTLDVHKKYNALVMSAFNNDAGFVAALDKVGVDCCTNRRCRRWRLSLTLVLVCVYRRADASSTTMQ